MTQLLNRFQNLSQRERMILTLGGIGALVILVYALLWAPWQEELNRLRTQVPIKQETLMWMLQQRATVGPLLDRSRQQIASNDTPLITVIEQSAKQAKMDGYIRRMAPGENGEVRLWLTEVDFDRWVLWMESLRNNGVEVKSATINQSPQNKVTIRVSVQR